MSVIGPVPFISTSEIDWLIPIMIGYAPVVSTNRKQLCIWVSVQGAKVQFFIFSQNFSLRC